MWWTDLTRHAPVALGVLGGSYVLGCFNTAYYLVRTRTGKDIRELGTGTAGAKNVSRVLGRTGFLLTVGGDILKGAIGCSVALALTGEDLMGLVAIMGVVAGHVWPIQLGFRGGKGVAASLGGLLFYSWQLTLCFCILYGLTIALTKKSTIGGLLSYALLPAAAYFLHQDAAHIWGISALAGLVILTHHRNITDEIHQLLPRRPDSSGPDSSSLKS